MRHALLPVFFLALAGAATAPGEAYVVKLDRPLHAGQRFAVEMSADQHTTTRTQQVNGDPRLREQGFSGEITGKMVVIEADKAGNPTKLDLAVTRFTVGKDKTAALPAGTVVHITRSEAGVDFAVKPALSDDARAVLAALFPVLRQKTELSDDAVAGVGPGAGRMRRVGETWNLRSSAFKDNSLDLDPRDIQSTITFKDLQQVAGIKALRLVWTVRMKDFKAGLPVEYLLDNSDATMEVTSVVPADTTLPALELSSTTDMTFAAHHNTSGAKVQITQHIVTRQKMTPEKASP